MPEQTPPSRSHHKRKSGGLTTLINAQVIKAMEAKARKEATHKKPPLLRRIMGAISLGLWMLFMIAEFFHWVEHIDTFGHDLTKWSPLFVGFLLLAPDAFDRLLVVVGRLKGLKISLPPKEEDSPN